MKLIPIFRRRIRYCKMKGTVILNISYVSVLLWQMLDWNWMITGMKSEWDPTQQLQGPAHTSEFSGGLCWESAWLDIKTSAFTKSWDSLSSFLFGIAAHTSVIFICWSWMRSTDISLLNKRTELWRIVQRISEGTSSFISSRQIWVEIPVVIVPLFVD